MPSLRPPADSGWDSDSESDAPEAISLSQSKKSIKQQNAKIHKAGILARQKIKLKNQEKDHKLKERAALKQKDDKVASKSGKRLKQAVSADEAEDAEEVVDEVEARMLRAMEDAEGEGNEGEGEGSDLDEDEGFSGFQEGSSFDGDAAMDEDGDSAEDSDDHNIWDDQDDDMEDADASSDDGVERTTNPTQPRKSVNYLPDEVFQAAFSQAEKPKPSQSKKNAVLSAKHQKKRRRSQPKDVIVGSKAIRMLASTTRPVTANAAVPSSKINRFLNRTLALKSQRSIPGKGWERRPANLGVLRRNGPPAHFVRKQ